MYFCLLCWLPSSRAPGPDGTGVTQDLLSSSGSVLGPGNSLYSAWDKSLIFILDGFCFSLRIHVELENFTFGSNNKSKVASSGRVSGQDVSLCWVHVWFVLVELEVVAHPNWSPESEVRTWEGPDLLIHWPVATACRPGSSSSSCLWQLFIMYFLKWKAQIQFIL